MPNAVDTSGRRIEEIEAKLTRAKFQIGELEEVADSLRHHSRKMNFSASVKNFTVGKGKVRHLLRFQNKEYVGEVVYPWCGEWAFVSAVTLHATLLPDDLVCARCRRRFLRALKGMNEAAFENRDLFREKVKGE